MVGPIVDTLKDLAGRWLMRSARTAKEHPFDAPHHYAPHEEPGGNGARPSAAPASSPAVAEPMTAPPPVNGNSGAPIPTPTPTEPPAPAAPAEASGATTATGRTWTADMRQVSPEPDGAVGHGIVNALRTCYDPEIPVNIYELGLIYGIELDEEQNAWLVMTLTSPMCPVAGSLPPEVQAKIAAVEGVKSAKVDVVWDPPWSPDMMSEAAKLELGML